MRALPVLLVLACLLLAAAPQAPAQSLPVRHWIVAFDELPEGAAVGGEYRGARILLVNPATRSLGVASSDPDFKAQAASDPGVRYFEPDRSYQILFTPGDPRFVEQYEHAQVRLPSAWDHTLGDVAAKVCVVDTGVRYTHEDLRGARWLGGVDVVNNDTDPWDDNGHGTHVAGIAAATVNNARGGAGAGNVGLYAVKAMAANGRGRWSEVAAGISWCADHAGPNAVISVSIAGGYSQNVHDAVRDAVAKGSLVVAAAGNDGPCADCISHPAALPEVVAVTCTKRGETRCDYSNAGPQAALAAPGDAILNACHASDEDYCARSGTSDSAPMVSGIAALLWSHQPSLTNAQLRERLFATAQDLGAVGRDAQFGFGEVDAKCLFENRSPCLPPPNDDMARAETVPTLPFRKEVSTRLAGVEPAEPQPCGGMGATVWFAWTAPAAGRVSAESAGGGFDTVLATYAGDVAGVPLSCGRDDALGGNARSRVAFDAKTGVRYLFQVGGAGGASGTARLSIACDACPDNNAFAAARTLAGPAVSVKQVTRGAGVEPGEPQPCGVSAATVWYRWRAPGPGLVSLDTLGAAFDTRLAVYEGPDLARLRLVACNDDADGTTQSRLAFHAVPGATYHVQVGGRMDAAGDARLSLQCPQCSAAPPHDDRAAARVLLENGEFDELSTDGATNEPGEPQPCGLLGKTVWYTFTPAHDATVIVNTEGSGFDTVLAAYAGASPAACLDDVTGWSTMQARLILKARANVTYHVQAGGFDNASGPLRVRFECLTPCFPPVAGNDARAGAVDVPALPWSASQDTVRYTVEPGETLPPNMGGTAWFRYAHPADAAPRVVTVHTYGSTFDTVLAAYAMPGYVPLAYSNDEPDLTGASQVRFVALPGQTYLLQAGGYAAEANGYPAQGLLRIGAS